MLRATRIESRATAGTCVLTAHVLVNRELSVAFPAKDGIAVSLMLRPDLGEDGRQVHCDSLYKHSTAHSTCF